LCVMIVDSPTTAQNICRGCQKCILEMFFLTGPTKEPLETMYFLWVGMQLPLEIYF
jgi:hypothetical protein